MKPDHPHARPANAIVRAVKAIFRLFSALLAWALKDSGSGNIYF